MAILNRYIGRDFLVTFLLTLAIFTFVMCIGAVVKAIDLVTRGVSGMLILKIFMYNVPYLLTFSIPMSSLTSILLLFSRLSFDGEITAMKACGLSIWQIIAPVLILSVFLSGVCVYLNVSTAPQSHYARRQLVFEMGAADPISLLEEGRFVDEFPGLMIYVGRKNKEKVNDVVVYEMDPHGITRSVRAKRGEMKMLEEKNTLLIDLYDVRIEQPDEKNRMDPSQTRNINAAHYPVKLDFSQMLRKGAVRKKMSDMTFPELIHSIRDFEEKHSELSDDEKGEQRMKMIVEANERLAMSFSCFAFALLGIPLGMRSRRKESSAGVGISLILVFMFYFFIIVADSLVGSPHLRPDLIVWIPVILFEIIGFILVQRAN